MFQKIFGLAQKAASSGPDKSQVEQNLSRIARAVPEARWLALVTTKGLERGSYPAQLPIEQDRVEAMSAAILSLGERIARELEDGNLEYSVIAGSEGVTLVLVLSRDYVLTLGLNPGTAVDTVLEKLREAVGE